MENILIYTIGTLALAYIAWSAYRTVNKDGCGCAQSSGSGCKHKETCRN